MEFAKGNLWVGGTACFNLGLDHFWESFAKDGWRPTRAWVGVGRGRGIGIFHAIDATRVRRVKPKGIASVSLLLHSSLTLKILHVKIYDPLVC